ncbi:hypothetical protein [Streptomyces sp. H27-D2]|uniref:hypothetical protein n=1 Tax=Streptomyces sp. H27-D2 TaxID=3046304 RepID=UPI002DBC03A0|nr:hypothetical protein [Streptomyces sp. H27-D2]MEC4019788.1 hypothetical protein [Streptomyces sp. H27-D2]
MRTLMTVQIDTDAGNQALKSGGVPQVLQRLIGQTNPEVVFFSVTNGARAAYLLFDLKDPSDMPRLLEPLFSELNAKVTLSPAMNLDDLTAGLGKLDAK